MVFESYQAHKDQIQAIAVRTREFPVYHTFYSLFKTLPQAIIYPNVFSESKQAIPEDIQEIVRYFANGGHQANSVIVRNVYHTEKTSILQKHIDFGFKDALIVSIKAPK